MTSELMAVSSVGKNEVRANEYDIGANLTTEINGVNPSYSLKKRLFCGRIKINQ